ncbi:class I SAM-dependent methyltransferase [Dictyobacter formicarum]|uniref:Methyltransferase domain-containing protein n=1 Tax=Dictyobacter formicarum TaxID=2778368 RepID=A0ABQ3VQ73_9CHLR|nr:class I SAM-dependent methyltransferase [Dictyobacter formicarum]GHO87743.1 hypothetical protein KSZ_57490 [Dictyobacter formicarum]
MASSDSSAQSGVLFENPFHIEDLQVFDAETMHNMLACSHAQLSSRLLADSLHNVSPVLITHIMQAIPQEQREQFRQELQQPLSSQEIEQARSQTLNSLFWELIYWKTPDLYEELTVGERLHEGIFQSIQSDLAGKIVLDAGAGSGRASFEYLRYGATRVHAVEPSPGLLRILRKKIIDRGLERSIFPAAGRFNKLPLADHCVDTALSCSAFTALEDQGGESGLLELRRVTRPGGKIIIVWPRTEDHQWLAAHGFQYVSLPIQEEMYVHFRSFESALRCARLFYAHNPDVLHYLQKAQKPEIPFSIIGMNPPRDYFWLAV